MRFFLCGVVVAVAVAATASAQPSELTNLLNAASQNDASATSSAIGVALRSTNPKIRAIAARVAAVRHMTELLTTISSLADRETEPNAAREELRAMIFLGGMKQIDRAMYISDRFRKRLDSDVANAVAHLGPAAIDAFFTTMQTRNIDKFSYLRTALWGRTEAVAPLARRLLANDKDGFETLMFAGGFEPRMPVDSDTMIGGMRHADLDVRAATIWFLLAQSTRGNKFDKALNEAIGAFRVPRDHDELIGGVELLRRSIGLPSRDFNEFRFALADPIVQLRLLLGPTPKVFDLMSDGERNVATSRINEDALASLKTREDPPPFAVPSALPFGLASTIMSMTGCDRGWIGTARITIDEQGFVSSRDLSNVKTTDACRRALNMLMDYSIAEPRLISSKRKSDAIPLVRATSGPMCFDEEVVEAVPGTYVWGSSGLRFPKVLEKVSPVWPANVEHKPVDVEVEVLVGSQGCVRSARVTKPSANPALNSAALVAAQQWKFEPGSLMMSAIDMPWSVTVQFRP